MGVYRRRVRRGFVGANNKSIYCEINSHEKPVVCYTIKMVFKLENSVHIHDFVVIVVVGVVIVVKNESANRIYIVTDNRLDDYDDLEECTSFSFENP